MSSYPTTKAEAVNYVKKAIDDDTFFGIDEKHNSKTYDGSTSPNRYFSVFNAELSDSKKLKDWMDEGFFSVSAFVRPDGKKEFFFHPSNSVWSDGNYTGSAYNPGDKIPSVGLDYFDVVSAGIAGVHGFVIDESYFADKIATGNLIYEGELE